MHAVVAQRKLCTAVKDSRFKVQGSRFEIFYCHYTRITKFWGVFTQKMKMEKIDIYMQ